MEIKRRPRTARRDQSAADRLPGIRSKASARYFQSMEASDGLRIEVRELREVVDRLFAHLEETSGDGVTLHEDYFYSVPFPEIYDVLSGPPQLTIGQLTESWENLQRARGGAIGWELVWLGDVLKAIGHLA